MLQVKDLNKTFVTGDLVQTALDGVSLNFRDSEFVAILGPSGSGKTTLLNIVGGLDRYDSGDLIINDVSTKDYKDADWDSYRNHTIGFVFQSYNLIPHQTILSNVELALTIGGISPKERKERAMKALEEVGLADQAHKKPTQMSGGQMQRVAIARALVNNPDILLADEPTGALDTETSVQVMELLKEVAKDRLVIMVTHNPELAEAYATRTVKLRDGRIIDDSDPFTPAPEDILPAQHKNLGKASMSFKTALALSLNNLMTKKARTILTAFAGSIGIIGIALILSLSTGFHNYINQIQEDTLTSYPLSITAETADMTSALLSMAPTSDDEKNGEKDIVKEMQVMSTMFGSVGRNDLESLKAYFEKKDDVIDENVSLIQYQYNVSPMIFTEDCNGDISKLNPNQILASMSGYSMTSVATSMTSVFHELVDDQKMLDEQYDVLAGRWPQAKDEAVIVLQDENTIPDLLVYSLGLRDPGELKTMVAKLMAGETVESENDSMEFTYDELMDIELKVVDASDTYKYNGSFDLYEDMSDDQAYMEDVYKDAMPLKITGVMCMKEGTSSMSSMVGVCYTQDLTKHVIDVAKDSPIVKKQLEDKEFNVFTGKRFDDESDEVGMEFQDMISIDQSALESAFGGDVSEETMTQLTEGYMSEISDALTTDTSKAKNDFNAALTTMSTDMLNDYIDANYQDVMQCAVIKMSDVDSVVSAYMNTGDCKALLAQLEKDYLVPQATFAEVYKQLLTGMLQGYIGTAPLDPNAEDLSAPLTKDSVAPIVSAFVPQTADVSAQMATAMTEAAMQKDVLSNVGELTGEVTKTMANAFNVDPEALASAFQFDLSEEELAGLMEAMSSSAVDANADINLNSLGYQDLDEPSLINIYFKDFDSKERFIEFLDGYNEKMEKKDEDKVISYTDITGLLMSSVSTIVDSVTYVLIAFVSISLIVSSIMIGIITYISVLERTKEIGILRAIGASKRNISSIFNAETFIVGLFAGILGIIVTLLLNIPINYIIHTLTNNSNITAVLPVAGGVLLVVLSVILTLISGLIPSKQAANKDPVAALRTE